MSAADIAAAIGGAQHIGDGAWLCRCPISSHGKGEGDRRPSLKLRDDPGKRDGLDVVCFAGCSWRDVKAELERRGLLAASGARRKPTEPRRLPAGLSDQQRAGRGLELWHEARPIAGTVAERYLAGRAITLTGEVLAADALRFHFRCPFGCDRYPAMLALMRDLHTDRPVAVHRTAILPDGSGKATPADGGNAKRMLGPVKGAAVKLIADDAVSLGLAIAEGIETALTMIVAGWTPVWAAGSTGAIRGFPVLAGIECLTIFADADDGGTGLADARHCAERWRAAGAEAILIAPPSGDWNDVVGGAA